MNKNSVTKVTLLTALFVSLIASQAPLHALAYVFSRNLTVGANGDDVRELQKSLNQDPVTRVANSGPGSPGEETSYFGSLTTQAVIKFQNKYAAEILVPLGLSAGTGYVGASTRQKLNALGSGTAAPTPSSPPPAYSGTFSRVLSLGSVGADVLELQKILNRDFLTRVANSGPGSPGEETSYFGTLTKSAVSKFQLQYATELLTPYGLQPSGIADSRTLAKIGQIVAGNNATLSSQNLIVFPPLDVSKFAVSLAGAQTFEEYYTLVRTYPPRGLVTQREYVKFLKDANGRVIPPIKIIENVLRTNSFAGTHDALDLFKRIMEDRINGAQQIPLASPNLPGLQELYDSYRLPIFLIDEFFKFESGKMSKQEFNSLYEKYKVTADIQRRTIEYYLESPQTRFLKRNPLAEFFMQASERIGLTKIANAIGMGGSTPYGGDVQEIDEESCSCSGEIHKVNDYKSGSRQLSLLLEYSSMGSNTVKHNGQVNEREYVLGNYSPFAICLIPSLDGCETNSEEHLDGSITIVGSSGGQGGGGGGF